MYLYLLFNPTVAVIFDKFIPWYLELNLVFDCSKYVWKKKFKTIQCTFLSSKYGFYVIIILVRSITFEVRYINFVSWQFCTTQGSSWQSDTGCWSQSDHKSNTTDVGSHLDTQPEMLRLPITYLRDTNLRITLCLITS